MNTSLILLCILVPCLCQQLTLKPVPKEEAKKRMDNPANKEKCIHPSPIKPQPGPNDNVNTGDLIYRTRVGGDRILVREVILIPTLASTDQIYELVLPHDCELDVTTVRFINLGRQRANGLEIDVATSNVINILFEVTAGIDPRILVEVYGKRSCNFFNL